MGRERHGLVAVIALAVIVAFAPPARAHGPGSPESYHWMRPPAGIDGAGDPGSIDVTYGPELFVAGTATAWTPEDQVMVRMTAPRGSQPGPVAVSVRPLDPASLETLPSDRSFNGNVYSISIDADGWHPESSIRLRAPYPASGLWHHESGGWQPVGAEISSREVTASIPAGTDVVLAVSWDPPSHVWYQQLAHAPGLVAATWVVAAVGGWTVGRRRRRWRPWPSVLPSALGRHAAGRRTRS